MDNVIPSTAVNTKKMIFISMDAFKQRIGLPLTPGNILIVKSPKSQKVFANTSTNLNFKAQHDIDLTQPVKFMYETEELFNEGCITNVTESANVLGAL